MIRATALVAGFAVTALTVAAVWSATSPSRSIIDTRDVNPLTCFGGAVTSRIEMKDCIEQIIRARGIEAVKTWGEARGFSCSTGPFRRSHLGSGAHSTSSGGSSSSSGSGGNAAYLNEIIGTQVNCRYIDCAPNLKLPIPRPTKRSGSSIYGIHGAIKGDEITTHAQYEKDYRGCQR